MEQLKSMVKDLSEKVAKLEESNQNLRKQNSFLVSSYNEMARFCDDAIVQQTVATDQLVHTIKWQQQHFQRVKTANEIVQKRKFDGLEKQKLQLRKHRLPSYCIPPLLGNHICSI